jgi:hypothetical protein
MLLDVQSVFFCKKHKAIKETKMKLRKEKGMIEVEMVQGLI